MPRHKAFCEKCQEDKFFRYHIIPQEPKYHWPYRELGETVDIFSFCTVCHSCLDQTVTQEEFLKLLKEAIRWREIQEQVREHQNPEMRYWIEIPPTPEQIVHRCSLALIFFVMIVSLARTILILRIL